MNSILRMTELYGAHAAGMLERATRMVESAANKLGQKLEAFKGAVNLLAEGVRGQWLPIDVAATHLQHGIAAKNSYFGLGDRGTQSIIDSAMRAEPAVNPAPQRANAALSTQKQRIITQRASAIKGKPLSQSKPFRSARDMLGIKPEKIGFQGATKWQ